MLYVSYERSYDTFDGSDQVYQLYLGNLEGDTFEPADAQTFNLSGPAFKENFPEITEFVQFGICHSGAYYMVCHESVVEWFCL